MDTESGRFVDESEATVDMNRYENGKLIVITGDVFRVVQVTNEIGRGELVLRALNRAERESEAREVRDRALKAYAISKPGKKQNRAERRKEAHNKRRSGKRPRG